MPSAAVAGHYEILMPYKTKQNKTVKTLDFFKEIWIAVKMSDDKLTILLSEEIMFNFKDIVLISLQKETKEDRSVFTVKY